MFQDKSLATAQLQETLENLVVFKQDNAKSNDEIAFWKGAGASLIKLNDFLDYVIQPSVAILLIREDLRITITDAENIHTTSRRYGLKFNFETDDG